MLEGIADERDPRPRRPEMIVERGGGEAKSSARGLRRAFQRALQRAEPLSHSVIVQSAGARGGDALEDARKRDYSRHNARRRA